MSSNIDPTKPTQGTATTKSVRDNFSAAKAEIEQLQRVTIEASAVANEILYYTSVGEVSVTSLTILGRSVIASETTASLEAAIGLGVGSDVQAWDPVLQDIADFSAAADQSIYFDSAGGATLYTITSLGRNIAGHSSTASVQAEVGLTIGSNVQAQDPVLQDLADVSAGVDQSIYFESANGLGLYTLTALGRAIAGHSSTASVQAEIGLTIGTDVQGFSNLLQDLAEVTPSADQVIYWEGATSATAASFTPFARTLVDDTSAGAARDTLGLGSLAKESTSVLGSAAFLNYPLPGVYIRDREGSAPATTRDDDFMLVKVNDNVTLPSASLLSDGYSVRLKNTGLVTRNITPDGTDTIDGTNAAIELPAKHTVELIRESSTAWQTFDSGNKHTYMFGANLTTAGNFANVNGIASEPDSASGVGTKMPVLAGVLHNLLFSHAGDLSANNATMKVHVNGSVVETKTASGSANTVDVLSLGTEVSEGDLVEIEYDAGSTNPGNSIITLVVE